MTEKLKKAFRTFPLANKDAVEEDSKVTIPSQDDVETTKEWVDTKEM